jgi:hypothetical protein
MFLGDFMLLWFIYKFETIESLKLTIIIVLCAQFYLIGVVHH